MLIAMLACTVDYGMEELYPFTPSAPPAGAVDVLAPAAVDEVPAADSSTLELLAPDADVDVQFNIWFEEGDWGETETRCTLELGFYVPEEQPVISAEQEEGTVVAYPEDAGDCAYTSFEGEDQAMGEPVVMRTRDAGEVIYLDAPDFTWTLELVEDQHSGTTAYALADCSAETFPFGETLSLDVPGGEGATGLEAFTIDDVITIGPSIHLDSPSNQDTYDDNVLDWDQDRTMKVGWHYGQATPTVDGEPLEGEIYLMIRNQWADSRELIEAMACSPEREEQFLLDSEQLHLLEANEELDDSVYSVAFQIDTWYQGPHFETPWGDETQVRSVFSTGGLLNLVE